MAETDPIGQNYLSELYEEGRTILHNPIGYAFVKAAPSANTLSEHLKKLG